METTEDIPSFVELGLDTTDPDQPTISFNPPAFRGKIQAKRNDTPLLFFGNHPFAIAVLRRIKGPQNDIKNPFEKKGVLVSSYDSDAPDYPWFIDPKDSIVRIPRGQWADYEFCYVVIMTTGNSEIPIVVSDDPKIIIGRETTLPEDSTSPSLTEEEVLRLLFPTT